jgi:hypothetical protein
MVQQHLDHEYVIGVVYSASSDRVKNIFHADSPIIGI